MDGGSGVRDESGSMNYRALYEWGRQQLASCMIEEADLDARLLLEEICQTGRHDMLAHGDRVVTGEQEERYVNWIDRRKKREPLQYIVGYQEFMGIPIGVDPGVLIPRQDTEILAEEALRHLHDGQALLDMCTGSGCILLSLLTYSNHCRGTGADISEQALKVAAENAARLHIEAQWIESDLFQAVTGKYDMIISNPPYIPSPVIEDLMEEVKGFEPRGALDGKEDGLFFYREIIGQAGTYLYPEGMLLLEIGCDQGEAVTAMMKAGGFCEVMTVKDFAGLDRVISGRWMGL